jgi:hypothetical protein
MRSEQRKIKSNSPNARSSTGPKTAGGKSRSAPFVGEVAGVSAGALPPPAGTLPLPMNIVGNLIQLIC